MGGLYVPAPPGSGISPPAGDIGGTAAAPTVTGLHLPSPLMVSQGGTGAGTAAGAAGSLAVIPSSAKGAVNGVATLDGSGYVPVAQLGNQPVGPVTDKGGQVYNVKAYGAAGNGSTDDTAAIQAAISAAQTAGGGVVYLPGGTYNISAALVLYSGVSLIGAGAAGAGQGTSTSTGATVINQTSATAHGISTADLQDVTIRALTLNGPGSGSGNGFYSPLSANGSQEHLAFQDVTIQGFGGNGLELQNPIVSRFDRVTSQNNGGKGFYIRGTTGGASGTSCAFNACWANTNATVGWHIYNMTYVALNACAADNNGNGYLIDTCQGVTLTGCGAEGITAQNSYDGTSFKITGSYAVSLVGCWTWHQNAVMLWVTGGSQNVFIAAVMENTPQASATASLKTDAGTFSNIAGYQVTTAASLAASTYNMLGNVSQGWTAAGTGYLGAVQVYGVAGLNAGSDTSGTAAESAPSFTSGAAKQLSTVQDVILYVTVKTSAALSVAIGPTSATAYTVMPSASYALGLCSLRVPKGWWVNITGTIADLAIAQVAC